MLQSLQLAWQEIIVWLILGLVVFALLHYIGRRWQSMKNITHKSSGKKLGDCTSCQKCPFSAQDCGKAENLKKVGGLTDEDNISAPDGQKSEGYDYSNQGGRRSRAPDS